MVKQSTSSRWPQEKLWRNTSIQILQRRLLFEYKYQMAMETVEQNTSKQVSAKETILRNVYKYSRKVFFFFESEWFWRKQSQGSGMMVSES